MVVLSDIAGHIIRLVDQGSGPGAGPNAGQAFSRLLYLLPLAARARDELLFENSVQALAAPPLVAQVDALFQILLACIRVISPGHVRIAVARARPAVPERTALGALACDFLSEGIEDSRKVPQLRPRLRPVMELLCSEVFPQILTQPNSEPVGVPCGMLQAAMGCEFYASLCNLLRVYWEEEFRETAQLRVLKFCTSMIHICDALCDRVRVPSARKSVFIPPSIALHVLLVCGRVCAEFKGKPDAKLAETFSSAQEIFNAYDARIHLPVRRREQQSRMERACDEYFRIVTGEIVSRVGEGRGPGGAGQQSGRATNFSLGEPAVQTTLEALRVFLEASGGEYAPAIGQIEALAGVEMDAILRHFRSVISDAGGPAEATAAAAVHSAGQRTGSSRSPASPISQIGLPGSASAPDGLGALAAPGSPGAAATQGMSVSYVWRTSAVYPRGQRGSRGQKDAHAASSAQGLPAFTVTGSTSTADALWRLRSSGSVARHFMLGSSASAVNRIEEVPLYVLAAFALQGQGTISLCSPEVQVAREAVEEEAREAIGADPLLLLPHEELRALLFSCYLRDRSSFPALYASLLGSAFSSGKHAPGIISALVHGPPCPVDSLCASSLIDLVGLSSAGLEAHYGTGASAELGVGPGPVVSLLLFLAALFSTTRGTSQAPRVDQLVAETLRAVAEVPYQEYGSLVIAFSSLATLYPDFIDFCGDVVDAYRTEGAARVVDLLSPVLAREQSAGGAAPPRSFSPTAGASAEIERAASQVALPEEEFDRLCRFASFFLPLRPELAVSLFLSMRSPLCRIRNMRVSTGLLSPAAALLPPPLRSLIHSQLVRGILGRAVSLIKHPRAQETAAELESVALVISKLEPSVIVPAGVKEASFSPPQSLRSRAADAYLIAHPPADYLLVILFAIHGNTAVLRPLYRARPVVALALFSAARSAPQVLQRLLDDQAYREVFAQALGDSPRMIADRVTRAQEERRALDEALLELERIQNGRIENTRNLGIQELEARKSDLQQERADCVRHISRLLGELKDRLELSVFREKGFEELFRLYERVLGAEGGQDARQLSQTPFLRGLGSGGAFSTQDMLEWIITDPAAGERQDCAEIVASVLNNQFAFDPESRAKWIRQFMNRRGLERFQQLLRPLV